jgi:hypothetical protein
MVDPGEIDEYTLEEVTESGWLYFSENERLEAFRWYILAADEAIEQNRGELKETFAQIFRQVGVDATDKLAEAFEESGETILSSSTYQLTLGQMGFARAVDNFTTYLKDLLSEAVQAQPRVISSTEKESLDFILNFDSMEELRSALAEKKIERLFYGGMEDIEEFFQNRLGVEIFAEEEARERAERLKEYRNLIVHNRGRVNSKFLKEYPESNYSEDDLLTFSFQDLSEHNFFFQQLVVRLDPLVAEKFDLDQYSREELLEMQDTA